jgi:hypothetical protein
MAKQSVSNQPEQPRIRVRQLILLRETGPKSAAWHAARAQLIWRLQDEIKLAEQRDLGEQQTTEPGEERT